MSSMFLTFAGGAVGCVVLVLLTMQLLRGDISKSVAKERELHRERIKKLDGQIEHSLDQAAEMHGHDELLKLQSDFTSLEQLLTSEIKKLETEDVTIKKLQGEIDAKELKHNQYKVGKENNAQIADQLQTNREQLMTESKRFEAELVNTKEQLDLLIGEVEANSAEQQMLIQLRTSLEECTTLLTEVTQTHEHATDRYVNLQKQYLEMEKEYKNLIEKQLAGQ